MPSYSNFDPNITLDINDCNILDLRSYSKNNNPPPKHTLIRNNKCCQYKCNNGVQCKKKSVCILYGEILCKSHANTIKLEKGLPCCAIIDIDISGKFITCKNPSKRLKFGRYFCDEHYKIDSKVCSRFPESNVCAICLNDNNENMNIITLNCNHIFHEHCILSWFENYGTIPTCPCCRKECHIETGLIPFHMHKNKLPITIHI